MALFQVLPLVYVTYPCLHNHKIGDEEPCAQGLAPGIKQALEVHVVDKVPLHGQ